jgi:hypothetical protein
MTWCAKIYDIFNGWNDDEHELPSTPAARAINGLPESSITSQIARLNNPYLERSHSISSINNPTNYNKQKYIELLRREEKKNNFYILVKLDIIPMVIILILPLVLLRCKFINQSIYLINILIILVQTCHSIFHLIQSMYICL